MKRNQLAVLLVSLFTALTSQGCVPAEDQRPVNVVVILIDDMGWMDTAVYGSSFYETRTSIEWRLKASSSLSSTRPVRCARQRGRAS